MKAVLQRVENATLSVDDKVVSQIGKGLVVYLGIGEHDTFEKATLLANKVAALRIFADQEDKINLNVMQAGNNALVVSNFTLCADTSRGHRPNFMYAMKPELANQIYLHFARELKKCGVNVQTGVFGANMVIKQTCLGPVNIILEN